MPIIQDPRYTETVLAGGVNSNFFAPQETSAPSPSAVEIGAAASRQATLAGAAYSRLIEHPDPDLPDAPPDFNPLDHIQGFEDDAMHFVYAQSPAEVQGIKSRLITQRADQDVLRRAGLGGAGTQLVMNLLDPSFLVAASLPELAMGKATRIARAAQAAFKGATGASAYEFGMNALQDNRSFQESLFNVGSGALLGGVLGSIGRRVPKEDISRLRASIEADQQGLARSVGAASAHSETTLEMESIAPGGTWLSKLISKMPLISTDVDVVMNADSIPARQAIQDLADVTQILSKNFEGIRTTDSVETSLRRHDAKLANLSDLLADQYAAYYQRTQPTERLSREEFWREVSRAARNEDQSVIAEVNPVAQAWRQISDPLYADAKSFNLVKDPQKVAQEQFDSERVSNFTGRETQRLYEEFLSRGAPGISDETSAVISKLKSQQLDSLSSIPFELKGQQLKDAVGAINSKFRNEVDRAVPGIVNRFIARVNAVAEGRAVDSDAAVRELAELVKKKNVGTILGAEVPHEIAPPVEARVVGARSYFRRMFDREMIRRFPDEWHSIVSQHFRETSDALPAEINAAVEDTTRKILHADVGESNWNTAIDVDKAGPLKARVLDIPDNKIEKFLVNDPLRVARAYVRDLGAQVEIARRFHGDVELKQPIQNIADDYDFKRERVRRDASLTSDERTKELIRLSDQETAVKDAIIRVRNRLLGTAGRISPDAGKGLRRFVAGSRGWRNIVASGKLGVTALTGGVMDTARIAAQYGFAPTIVKIAQLALSPEFRALSYAQARRVGSAVEVALSRRVNAAYEGAITEGWTERLANGVYKWSGLNHITDFNRTLSATLLEDSVLGAVEKLKAGQALPSFERARLASLGLGDRELAGIAEQVAVHGGEIEGIRVSGSADWTDKRLADIYDSAILKESKIVVQQPGVADRVWWMDKETGKVIGQLKSFGLSAPSRLLTPGLQMARGGEIAKSARFFGYMMVGGYLAHVLRQFTAGQQPTTDIATATNEAFNESGIGGVLPDVISPVARSPLGRKFTGDLIGESARFSDRNVAGAFLGPAAGTAQDAIELAFNRTANGLSAADLHVLRRLLPYQNLWFMRRAINALEGESADALDLTGATRQSFSDRFLETKPSLAAAERGTTGTGRLVQ